MFALSKRYDISFNDIGATQLKLDCKSAVKIRIEIQWLADSQNVRKKAILRSYSLYIVCIFSHTLIQSQTFDTGPL